MNLQNSTIGNFQITDIIGEGGMAIVYKGFAPAPGGGFTVAIKMLKPEFAKEKSIRQRFMNEAEIMKFLRHPNIVWIHEFLQTGNDLFLVMEFVEGGGIDGLMERSGVFSPSYAANVLSQALEALALAHSHNPPIIHRDIKPGNILVDRAGRVKLTDFGISRIVGTTRLTAIGAKLGTLGYMSPEQFKGRQDGHEVDARTDIYALGITLYEMATGNVPFDGKGQYQTMTNILTNEPPPPSYYYPQIDKTLEQIIMKAIEKDPNRRYQSALEFKRDIDRFLPGTSPIAEYGRRENSPKTFIDPPPMKQEAGMSQPNLSEPGENFKDLALQAKRIFKGSLKKGLKVIQDYVEEKDNGPSAPVPVSGYNGHFKQIISPQSGNQIIAPPATALGTLIALGGSLAGRQFPLIQNGVKIGRDPMRCQIAIPEGNISGEHAWIGPLEGRVALMDLNSTNGTFLNRQRVYGQVLLQPNDVFQVGSMGGNSFVYKNNH